MLLLAVVAAGTACTAARCPEVMTWEEYGRQNPHWPYVIHFRARGGGELLYFGSRHVYRPDDPMLAEIERLWADFRPDIAFNEGGNPPVEATRERAVRRHGEPGLVRFLGARDDVPVASLEPSDAEVIADLRRSFTAEEVKLSYLLRFVDEFPARESDGSLEEELGKIFRWYDRRPGLGGPPHTLEELEEVFERRFPGLGSYRDVPHAWFDPVRSDTVLNRIARAGSDYRDRHMVELLSRHVAEGQRVFAVVGGTHVVMQEPALRGRIRTTRGAARRLAPTGLPACRAEISRSPACRAHCSPGYRSRGALQDRLQLVRSLHREPGAAEAVTVAGDDPIGAGQPGGLVQYRVLEVVEGQLERQRQRSRVDRRDGEESEELADRIEGLPPAERLGQQVVDRRHRRTAEQTLDLPPFDAGDEARGGRRERPAIEQEVEHHVGVEQHPHRCLSSRWRR